MAPPVTFNPVVASGEKKTSESVNFFPFVPENQNGGFIRTLDGIPQMVGKLGKLGVSIIQDGGRVKASLSNANYNSNGYRALEASELTTLGQALDAWLTANEDKYAPEPRHWGGPSGTPQNADGTPFVDNTGYVSKGDYDAVASFREIIRSFEKKPVQPVVVETPAEKKQRLGFDPTSHFTY